MRPQLVIDMKRHLVKPSKLLYQMRLNQKVQTCRRSNYSISVNRYERNRKAKNECIKYYGSSCYVCGFNFGVQYGPIGEGKIHVHHLIPLSEIKKEYVIDPIKDLRPVCPNCHLIIHSKKEPFSIDEVKEMLRGEQQRITQHCRFGPREVNL